MSRLFESVAREKVPYNVFPAGGDRKLSFKMGQIVPIFVAETLPGDVFRASTELLIKFAPLKAPVMHRIRAYIDYFYIPNYQICEPFGRFINPRINTPDNPVLLPKITPWDANNLGKLDLGSLADYMDLPVQQSGWKTSNKSKPLSVLPFRAYQHIYNSYFRDQTLQPMEGEDPLTTDLYLMEDKDAEGVANFSLLTPAEKHQLANMMTLRYSAWKKDYFTSALPSPQAGPEVEIPFTPGVIQADGVLSFSSENDLVEVNHALSLNKTEGKVGKVTLVNDSIREDVSYSSGLEIAPDPGSSALTINKLRVLFAFQHFQELQARGGSREPEITANYFGVRLPDLYVDRPAYLGGVYQDVSVGEVLQTSQTTLGETGSAQGYRAGVASVYGKSKVLRYSCKLWGYIIGVLRVLPEAVYYQGVERMWTRESLFDYAWPQFANMGEQEIYNRELYVDGSDEDNEVFGYAPRYAEYKTGCSHVNGEFRDSLSYWHFGRKFAERPALNAAFIEASQISTDPFNVTDDSTDKLYCHMYTKASVLRSQPYYGTPGLTKL